jgi:hypothetical protein
MEAIKTTNLTKQYKDKTAVINDANAKLRKNILGVNISNIKNPIPQTAMICQTIISPPNKTFSC